MKAAFCLSLVASLAACSSKKDDDTNKNIGFMAAIPATYRAADNSLPVGQCLPLQVYVVDATTMKPVPAPSDFTVTLKIQPDALFKDGDAQLHAYSDKDCTAEVASVKIAKATGGAAFSGVDIFAKAAAKGRGGISMTADNVSTSTGTFFKFN